MQLPDAPRILAYAETDSTNERAFAAIADGTAENGDLHVAEFQTQGRGRLGRQWRANAGEGLLFSLVLFPEPPLPKPAQLTVATCLALYDAVHELGLSGARLKWPNDLLVGDSKLCGILLETRGLDEAKPHFVVGVGLNVGQREFPPEVTDERAVTSLALEGVSATRDELLERIWKQLTLRLQQASQSLFIDYTRALELPGNVVVRDATREVRGTLLGVDLEHGVRVRTSADALVDMPLEFVRELRSDAAAE